MAKMKMKPVKDMYKQDKYEPIVKKKSGEMTIKKATKLKSDRTRGY